MKHRNGPARIFRRAVRFLLTPGLDRGRAGRAGFPLMARTRRRRSPGGYRTLAPAPRAASPIVRIQTAPAMERVRRRAGKTARRSYRKLQTAGIVTGTHLIAYGGAGAAMGFLEKQFGGLLPSIPVVGKKGALTIAAYFLARQGVGGQIVRDIAVAGAAVCGYQLGKDGRVDGEGDDY